MNTNQQNLEKTITEAKNEFEKILLFVTQPSENSEIHQVERGIFQKLLTLGAFLLKIFLLSIGTGNIGPFHTDKQGVTRKRHGIKTRMYQSVFGKIVISRFCYWSKGVGSIFPLDAILNLPKGCYSYLLQEWGMLLGVQSSWEKVTNTLKNMLKLDVWNSCLERISERTEQDVPGFYEYHSQQKYQDEAELLVVTVDCKGVPIKKDEPVQKKIRLKKGEKPGKKKMSTVTAVYTIGRHQREIHDIVKDSIDTPQTIREPTQSKNKDKPKPKNKIVKATLEGKETAFKDLVQQVKSRDPESKKECVALVDGERKLRELLTQNLPGFCIVLDLYHVLEYLWEAAYVFHSEGSIAATTWMQCMLRLLLQGKVEDIILYLRGRLQYCEFSKTKRACLEKVIGYLDRGKLFMRYDVYIARGYPIGSGVIEGACKNLVKDRMELSGMRWTIQRAEAMLRLRSVAVNDLNNAFWNFRVNSQRECLYGFMLNDEERQERLVA